MNQRPSSRNPRFRADAVEPDTELRTSSKGGAPQSNVCACCGAPFQASHGFNDGLSATTSQPIHVKLDLAATAVESRMIAWRRDLHANPELGNQEHRTAALVATHLRSLAYEVRDNIAVTGLVAVLRGGGGSGPVIAMRADMDALPVAEEVALPFASKSRALWDGVEVPVMHACGHDCHVAILMAAAEILASMKAELRGTVMLVFQPAEENLPRGEIGGAKRMLEEGAFNDPKPDVVVGLHVVSGLHAGTLGYRPGPAQASADEFRIIVHGRQTHGARPWAGVDPIVIGAQIVTALQTIQSRQIDVDDPSVLTVGTFQSGSRSNIVPNNAVMTGTLRTYSEERRKYIIRRVTELSQSVAAGMDGRVDVMWWPNGYPTLVNDQGLADRMASTLARVAGSGRLFVRPRGMAADDFAYFAQIVPGFFFQVGITETDVDPRLAAPNHSPQFRVDESGLLQGLRALLHIVVDYSGSRPA